MKTCENCESVSGMDIHRQTRSPGTAPGQETADAYNARLEELRSDGYAWDPTTRAMVKQCETCAAEEAE